ncbi:MAG: hypothetical protein JOY83_13125 [Alphaproteobacteria bacterium]|nr:hypothetical protein [Alphaproteobacteria bacterium]
MAAFPVHKARSTVEPERRAIMRGQNGAARNEHDFDIDTQHRLQRFERHVDARPTAGSAAGDALEVLHSSMR